MVIPLIFKVIFVFEVGFFGVVLTSACVFVIEITFFFAFEFFIVVYGTCVFVTFFFAFEVFFFVVAASFF